MSNTTSESGSHVIALGLGLVVVAVVGFGGYRVWQMQQAAAPASDTETVSFTVSVPKKITNTASLKQAATALDQSSAQVNTTLDDSALSSDLNDLL